MSDPGLLPGVMTLHRLSENTIRYEASIPRAQLVAESSYSTRAFSYISDWLTVKLALIALG